MLNTLNTDPVYRYIAKSGTKVTYTDYFKGIVPNINLAYEDKDYEPENGGDFCVMLFHTHPPLTEYKISEKTRKTGLSSEDLKEKKIPSVVRDYLGAEHSSKDSIGGSFTNYHNGIRRRGEK